MKKFMLIDGYSMLFRGYYATAYTNVMKTSKGIATNAVFAFNNMLMKAIELIQPDYLMVAFDKGKKNFRHEIFGEYKGTRKPAPEDLCVQFPIIREYLTACGIPYVEMDGYEADDIIGSSTRYFKDVEFYVFTSDRDLLQVINDTTKVILMKSGITELKIMDEPTLFEDFQLKPLQIIDFKGLSGDKSDNIPGIEKVGEKTAVKWLNTYGTLENVLDHADDIGGKMAEKLKESREIALLSKQLATIRLDIEIPITLEDVEFHLNKKTLASFYEKYEMKSLLNKLDIAVEQKEDEILEIEIVKSLQISLKAHMMYFDDVFTNAVYIYDSQNIYKLPCDAIGENKEYFEKQIFYTHDVKAHLHKFKKYDIYLNKACEDLRILEFLIDPSLDNQLDGIMQRYTSSNHSYVDKVLKGISLDMQEQAFAYAVAQFATIFDKQMSTIETCEMQSLYYDVELPLTHVLYDMECIGVACERNTLNEIAIKTKEKLEGLQAQIYFMASHEFNINSPKQLATVLFDELMLPCGKKKSTNVDVLEGLIDAHPIIPNILEYRKYQKLLSTYAEGLQKYIQEDGKIHTMYNQCLTTTGRLSSSDPNLQNISVRNEETREIRRAFIPANPQNILLAADYSQVELRMLAHFSHCNGLIDAFKQNEDVHLTTAMKVFKVEKENVSALMRRQAKAVNFGIVYGISDFGLANQIGTSRKQAGEFIQSYFEAYPEIKNFMDEVVKECEQNGYVTTILHRRRYLPDIHASSYMVKEAAKRAAMNAPIQGSAADLIKVAMIKVHHALEENNLKSKMILQVHDELILEVVPEEKEIVASILNDCMEHAIELSLPLEAKVCEGSNWLEAK